MNSDVRHGVKPNSLFEGVLHGYFTKCNYDFEVNPLDIGLSVGINFFHDLLVVVPTVRIALPESNKKAKNESCYPTF